MLILIGIISLIWFFFDNRASMDLSLFLSNMQRM
jgi:hypothetical protein